MPRWRRSRVRSRSCARSIRRPAWSSTTLKRSGRRPWRPCARPWRAPARRPAISRRSASPTSARPRSSGTAPPNRPIHNAIVWQDRRTADRCAALRQDGHEAVVTARTGLLLDPYFSATKIAWLLDHVEGARAAARAGRLAFGTVDSFLLWRLTGGQGARDRCDQCLPHLAVGHPPRQLGRRALPTVRRPRGALAAGARLRRRLRHDRSCSAGRSASWESPATSRRRWWGRAALRPAW